MLAAGNDQAVSVWNVRSGSEFRRFGGLGPLNHNSVVSVAFSPDGKTLAGATDGLIKLWDVHTGALVQDYNLGTEKITFLGFVNVKDGAPAVISANDHALRVWQPGTNHTVRSDLPSHFPLSSAGDEMFWKAGHLKWTVKVGSDGSTLILSYRDKTKLIDFSTGQARTLSPVGVMALSPDGKTAAAFGPANKTGGVRVKLYDTATEKELATLDTSLDEATEPMVFSPDGKTLALSGTKWNRDDRLIIYSTQLLSLDTNQVTKELDGKRRFFWAGGLSPDGKVLVLGEEAYGSIQLWNIKEGNGFVTIRPDTDGIPLLSFSADGKYLATREKFGPEPEPESEIWDVSTGRKLSDAEAKEIDLTNFESTSDIGPDDKRILVPSPNGLIEVRGGDTNGALDILNAKTGELLALLIDIGANDWLVVAPNGLFDGSPAGWRQLLWRFNNDTFDNAPLEAFFKEFYYPGLLQEIMEGRTLRPPDRNLSEIDIRQPDVKILAVDDQKLEVQPSGHAAVLPTVLERRAVEIAVEVAENNQAARHANRRDLRLAQDLRLFRNGSLVKHWKGNVFDGENGCEPVGVKSGEPRRVICKATAAITAGENLFTAYAFNNDNVKSNDFAATLTGGPSLKRDSTLFVLAVGVNEYANRNFSLTYAVPDARDFAAEVEARQKHIKQYARTEVITLYDAQAKKQSILNALVALSKKVQPEDAVIVYFAGHGTIGSCWSGAPARDRASDRFYLVPYDLGYSGKLPARCVQSMLDTIVRHSISDVDLEQAFELMDAGQLLLVIDACNSGRALESEEKRRGPMNSRGLAQLAYEKGMYVLSAAQSFQAAKAPKRLGHGYLTYVLVAEGLRTPAADVNIDGQVVLREWLDYAVRRVPRMQMEEEERRLLVHTQAGGNKPGGKAQGAIRQQPRVFYRRERDAKPLVVAKP